MKMIMIGSSMEPLIKINDIIDVDTKIKPKNFRIGDIVTWKLSEKNREFKKAEYETHRLIYKRKINNINYYYCKGDLREKSTAKVEENRLIGRVAEIMRNNQKINMNKINYKLYDKMLLTISLLQAVKHYAKLKIKKLNKSIF